MKKLFFESLVVILLFFTIWYLFSLIKWDSIFNTKNITINTEEKLGNMFWDLIKKSEKVNNDIYVVSTIDSLVNHICVSNNISNDELKVHILESNEINAFALPNKHLIIYTGLIKRVDECEELSGVICHEIAHIELNHVMKKLIKEVGLSVLISITMGEKGIQVIKETLNSLSSKAFDRSIEKEADLKAVDYLINSKINPDYFANFLFKLSLKDYELIKTMDWLSTHPNSEDRSIYINDYCKKMNKTNKPVIKNNTWNELRKKI